MKNKNPFLVTSWHNVFVPWNSKSLQKFCNFLFPLIIARQLFFGGDTFCYAPVLFVFLSFFTVLDRLDSLIGINRYNCVLSVGRVAI